jgi:MFS family permease
MVVVHVLYVRSHDSRFFIIGSLLAVVGSIVGATAQSINTLIGATVILGVSAAFQISFFWVISEIVPMKWRYVVNSYCYLMTIPTNPLAAKIAFTFQKTKPKWRARQVDQ